MTKQIHINSKVYPNNIVLVSDEDFDYINQWLYWLSGKGKYAQREGNRYMHIDIMEHRLGRELEEGELVDHWDLNGLNNVFENLRLSSKSQNMANRLAPANNTSGYKGVTFNKRKQKWQAQITYQYKHTVIGLFNTPQAAFEAYKEKANELFGEFANTEMR